MGKSHLTVVAQLSFLTLCLQVMADLVQLLEQEPFAQVMNEARHPADFARTEEDAEVGGLGTHTGHQHAASVHVYIQLHTCVGLHA